MRLRAAPLVVAWAALSACAALIDLNSGKKRELRSSAETVELVFSPDGARLVSRGSGTALLWSVTDERLIAELPGASEGARFSPDGRFLTTSVPPKNPDLLVQWQRLWDTNNGALLRLFNVNDAPPWMADVAIRRASVYARLASSY